MNWGWRRAVWSRAWMSCRRSSRPPELTVSAVAVAEVRLTDGQKDTGESDGSTGADASGHACLTTGHGVSDIRLPPLDGRATPAPAARGPHLHGWSASAGRPPLCRDLRQ